MHETKALLIERYGLKCMLCGREYNIHELQWHHIKPKYASKRDGQPIDNSIDNASLLCANCHQMVHQYDYNDLRYKAFMTIIASNKNNPNS